MFINAPGRLQAGEYQNRQLQGPVKEIIIIDNTLDGLETFIGGYTMTSKLTFNPTKRLIKHSTFESLSGRSESWLMDDQERKLKGKIWSLNRSKAH